MRIQPKYIFLEAGIATAILALILFLVFPHFLANQKFGLVQESEIFVRIGQWQWESFNTVTSGNGGTPGGVSFLLFRPNLPEGEMTCQFQVEGPLNSIGLIFDAPDLNKVSALGPYNCWKIGLMNERLVTYIARADQKLGFTYQSVQIDPTRWNDLRLVLNQKAGKMEGFLNGEKIIECLDRQPRTGGIVGIETCMTVARFKDIKVSSHRMDIEE